MEIPDFEDVQDLIDDGIEERVITEEESVFAVVELKQLKILLQRCHECGRIPGGPSKGKLRNITWKQTGGPSKEKLRNITWKQTGSNLTAHYRCACKDKCSWSTQSTIPGTDTRLGNLALVAAAHTAPIGYPDLASFFHAAKIPIFAKRHWHNQSRCFVFPTIEDHYFRMNADLKNSLVAPIKIAVDGQYDSPGYSAQLCAVSAVEDSSKQVVDFACVEKHEVGGISGRMELKGVQKVLESVQKTNEHTYAAVERAKSEDIVEDVFSFFMHVRGVHSWQPGLMKDLIPQGTAKIGKEFSKLSFSSILGCHHAALGDQETLPVASSSVAYQVILSLATKTTFLNDLKKMHHGNFTSFVESFNSVAIHYRPKRKYFPIKGFMIRTMLAALSYNENRRAEDRGERVVKRVCMMYSKSKGEMISKIQKGPIYEKWKEEIIDGAIKKKIEQGYGLPDMLDEDKYMHDGDDFIADELAELLNFDEEEESELEVDSDVEFD
uniref:Uncharacterized protein n=1 Tax=Acrobeloides nanus TaxID=290746 RepID=A0A914D5Q4_9BILA